MWITICCGDLDWAVSRKVNSQLLIKVGSAVIVLILLTNYDNRSRGGIFFNHSPLKTMSRHRQVRTFFRIGRFRSQTLRSQCWDVANNPATMNIDACENVVLRYALSHGRVNVIPMLHDWWCEGNVSRTVAFGWCLNDVVDCLGHGHVHLINTFDRWFLYLRIYIARYTVATATLLIIFILHQVPSTKERVPIVSFDAPVTRTAIYIRTMRSGGGH